MFPGVLFLFFCPTFFLPFTFFTIIAPPLCKSRISCFVIASLISSNLDCTKIILFLPTLRVLAANCFFLSNFILLPHCFQFCLLFWVFPLLLFFLLIFLRISLR